MVKKSIVYRGISGKAPGGGAFFLLASFEIKKFTKSKSRLKYGSESKFFDNRMTHTVFVSGTLGDIVMKKYV